MKIILFGSSGQVGSAILKSQNSLATILTPTLDISDSSSLEAYLHTQDADMVINAAAYTSVDRAEEEPELARLINAQAPAILSHFVRKKSMRMIHFSTDYVFDGQGDLPWTEKDTPNPINVYGQTKYDGDRAILDSGCNNLIIRTSWIYGMNGDNFIKKILRTARNSEIIEVIDDQVGCPNSADFLAQATWASINMNLSGLYHVTCQGYTSWYSVAKKIIEHSHKKRNTIIKPISTDEYGSKATKRPLNSRLCCNKWIRDCGIIPPPWQDEVIKFLSQIEKQGLHDI
jgi:dTDP-4-dehydrorhamnose reductase